eukprot:1156363-Pelagomonas_calceolata.AAC.11
MGSLCSHSHKEGRFVHGALNHTHLHSQLHKDTVSLLCSHPAHVGGPCQGQRSTGGHRASKGRRHEGLCGWVREGGLVGLNVGVYAWMWVWVCAHACVGACVCVSQPGAVRHSRTERHSGAQLVGKTGGSHVLVPGTARRTRPQSLKGTLS